MEMTTIAIWGSIGAAFCLFVGALIGFTIFERQVERNNAAARDAIETERASWRRMLEEAHGSAVTAEERWAFADKYRKAIVQAMVDHSLWDFAEHGPSPTAMLANLCNHVAECAIDPTQNQKAKNLYIKGVRAGAKKGRAQMQKIMQKSIDNQATAIRNMFDTLAIAHKREDIYREAVSNTLTDKVGLVGVRRAIVQGIAAECTRLRAVEAKKGE